MPPDEDFKMPDNYVFAAGGVPMHKDAYERISILMERAQNRDPDVHNMYVYNDFFGYGVLELVDETLSSIHTFAMKKDWMKTWHAIVALSCFMDMCPDWANVDDGERVRTTVKIFGALVVTTIVALDTAAQFNEELIPDLEKCLRRIAGWSDVYGQDLKCEYSKVIKGYGKKLFGDRTEEERRRIVEMEEKAYEEFVKTLSKAEREKRGDVLPSELRKNADGDDDDEDEDEEEGKGPWYGKAKVKDAAYTHPNFKFTPIWRVYKNYIASVPRLPLRGPPIWDITKWPAEAKKEFSFANYDDD